MNKEELKLKRNIIKLLSEFIGADPEDINDEDLLREDLHMGSVDLNDFLVVLENNNFSLLDLDIADVETVEELVEALI